MAELKKIKFAKFLTVMILSFAIAAGVSVKYVGTGRGEIRHPDIRDGAKVIPVDGDHDDDSYGTNSATVFSVWK